MDMILLNEINKLQSGGGSSSAASPLIGKKEETRFKEPCFAVVTVHNDNYWGTHVYDHNLNLCGSKYYSQSSQGTQGTNSTHSSEMASNYYSYSSSQSTVSSSSDRGNRTSAVGHCGHCDMSVSGEGEMSFHNGQQTGQSNRNVGTWLHNSTPELAIYQQDNYLYIAPRSHSSWNQDTSSKGNGYQGFWGARTMNSTSRYGMMSYNEKTKKFAMVENTNGSGAVKLHVWSDVESPATFKTNAEFFGTSNLNDSTKITSNTEQTTWYNESEGRYRATIVMCDNGDVFLSRFSPHQGTCFHKWTLSGGNYNSFSNPNNMSATTTYGMEQGNRFGMRFQISNDGKYIIAFGYYYYYGCGFQASLTRVSDGKTHYWQDSNTTHGWTVAPWRDSGFVIGYSENSDNSNGAFVGTLDAEALLEASGDGASFNCAWVTSRFDSHYNSTNYPYILPIMNQNWSKFVNYEQKYAIEVAE
tara:strand:- start:52 stop:1461 length:1410 start_codon:yes stop_codon:yes gene_type:complete